MARWWIDKAFRYERQVLAAARPIARSLLDISLPSQAVFADIERLSQKVIVMNEILRDRDRSSSRGISPPGAHRTVRDSLPSYGSCRSAFRCRRSLPMRK